MTCTVDGSESAPRKREGTRAATPFVIQDMNRKRILRSWWLWAARRPVRLLRAAQPALRRQRLPRGEHVRRPDPGRSPATSRRPSSEDKEQTAPAHAEEGAARTASTPRSAPQYPSGASREIFDALDDAKAPDKQPLAVTHPRQQGEHLALAAGQPAADPADRRRAVLRHEPGAGRRQPGDELRPQQGQARQQGHPEDHLRRRRRRGRGDRGTAGDQGVPRQPRQVPGDRREDPEGRAALRPARYRQDAARPRGRRRGGRAVLLDLRLGLRRDVRRRRRLPRPRPVRAGQGQRAGDHLRRRDRRRRPAPRRRPRRRPRRARADAQPAARRDGRLRRQGRRHPDRGHQPARHPRPGAAAPGPLRPADRRRPAGRHRPRGRAEGARQGQAVRRRRRPRRHRPAHARLHRRRPRERHQRGRAAHRAQQRPADHHRRRSRSRSTASSPDRSARRAP